MSSSVTTTFNAWLGRPPFTSLLFLVTKLAAIGEYLMSTTLKGSLYYLCFFFLKSKDSKYIPSVLPRENKEEYSSCNK